MTPKYDEQDGLGDKKGSNVLVQMTNDGFIIMIYQLHLEPGQRLEARSPEV